MALTVKWRRNAEWQLIQVLGNGRKVGSLIVAEKDLNYAGNYD